MYNTSLSLSLSNFFNTTLFFIYCYSPSSIITTIITTAAHLSPPSSGSLSLPDTPTQELSRDDIDKKLLFVLLDVTHLSISLLRMSSINTSGASSAQVELSEATKEEEAGAKAETKDSEPPVS